VSLHSISLSFCFPSPFTSVIDISTVTHNVTAEVGPVKDRLGESGSKVSLISAGMIV
jgi:hypothetical protein